MCLIVKKETKEKIAKKDIICYKRIKITSMESESQNFKYELGRLYRTKFTLAPKDARLGFNIFVADEITDQVYRKYFNNNGLYSGTFCGATVSNKVKVYQQGFHSYKENIERDYSIPNVECTIPKGTKYIEDETGLICSEAIIVNRILEENK